MTRRDPPPRSALGDFVSRVLAIVVAGLLLGLMARALVPKWQVEEWERREKAHRLEDILRR